MDGSIQPKVADVYEARCTEEFEKQQMRYGRDIPIIFENYRNATRVADFHKACEEHR